MISKYIVRPVKHEGWAIIYIDTENGFFATVSDYGNYSFQWTAPGCEFRKFLAGLTPDYLHGKLMMGRPDKNVFDGDATMENVREAIEELRDNESAYDYEQEVLEDFGSFEDRSEFDDWLGCTRIDGAYELQRTIPEPGCKNFCEKVWPRFVEMLSKEQGVDYQEVVKST